MALSIKEYLERGPATSREIQAATGLSQSAVARQLRGMGKNIIKLQNGRSPRYATTCNAFGGNDKLPLSIVDAHGNTVLAANIRPLTHGGFFVEPATGMPPLLLGESKDGLYDDLPYFLLDLAPQGFLGRQIAEVMAAQSDDFPTDPRRWNTNHIGRYLVSNGDDLSGNFKFGEQALLRVRRKPAIVSDNDYPELANNVMNGVLPNSSAGGEQPKFTAFSSNSSSHVIVKFSPQGDNEIARRWRDILITEYHATEAIHKMNFPAAETRLFEMDGRLFLESQRFDRSGEYGRMSMTSLQSIDAEFTGLGSGWPQVFDALHKKDLVSWQHVYDAECLWCFGRMINNTDMHLGNLSLAIDGSVFRLLPLYDMCSMGFAPKSGGEVPPYNFVPIEPKRVNIGEDVFKVIKAMAQDFWKRVASDERISGEFKAYLELGNPIDLM
jgi:hypothetical protein